MGIKDKKSTTAYLTPLVRKLAVLLISIVTMDATIANPVGGNVTSGNATITQAPGTTTINQTSNQAIINWQSFNIGNGEKTQFNQPSSSSITLNRINPGQGVSQIFGQLTANGRIILVNEAGIYFGPTSFVNVGSIIASARGMTDQNFLAGKYIFDKGSRFNGTVINQGTIIAAQHGLVALLGSNVSNEGYIRANLGNVILASGDKFTVDLDGDGLVNFAINTPSQASGVDQNGNVMTNGVNNSGKIIANGGTIILSAQAAQGVVENVINMSGVAVAHSVSQQNGEIILSGGSEGTVNVSGKLIASGKKAGQTGGTVKVLGANVVLQSPTVIDVSGYNGGGTINIGGDFHGAGPDQDALTTIVDSGVTLNANALMNGNGGNVSVWSNLNTVFNGSITAEGGVFSGNGGYVETSGGFLDVSGAQIDTLAPNGLTGTWLLDPSAVTISSSADSDESLSGGTYTPTGNTSNILNTELDSELASSNITVTTSGGSAATGSITVEAPITWATTNTLTLLAQSTTSDTITINSNGASPMINATGGGSLTLTAGSSTGTITINGGITLTGTSTSNGTLTLSASNTSESITTGANGAINVENFNLSQGQWYQDTASLPTFSVANNFQIASGASAPTTAEFLRVTGGTGASGTPYQITDVYGLQGMATNDTSGNNLLTKSFELVNSINASGTSLWNSGAGFVPIGNATTAFTGNLSGQNNTISNLYIDRTGGTIGLFGNIGSGTFQNIILSSPTIIANDGNIGSFAGETTGSTTVATIFSNITILNPTVTAGSGNCCVGGFIGNVGMLSSSDLASTATGIGVVNPTVSGPVAQVGGMFGTVAVPSGASSGNGTFVVSDSYVSGGTVTSTATGTVELGGFVGNFLAFIQNSYSTASVSDANSSTGVGGFNGRGAGGTILDSYSTGSVSGSGGGFNGLANGTTYTGDFWDTTTSGQSSSASGKGMSTANFMVLANFDSATTANGNVNPGWNITSTATSGSTSPNNVWFIIPNETRPILLSEEFPTQGGSVNNPIVTAYQLQLIDAAPGESYTLGSNITFSGVTANDIWGSNFSSMTGAGFVPIGSSSNVFSGSFNGEGYTINDLYINANIVNEGLFGEISGSISNVGVTNASINPTNAGASGNGVGILVGDNSGGTITDSYSTGSVGSSSDTSEMVGGLVGINNGSITDSYSTANVETDNSYVGGLVGINGNGGNGSISQSYSTGTVTQLGGTSVNAGGLVGAENNTSSITNSYSLSTVTGIGNVGGLVGDIAVTASTVSDSYSTGAVSGSGSNIGGFIGLNSGTGNLSNNFFNTSTSNFGATAGCGNVASCAGVTGETTAAMETPSTFINAGWDFSTTPIWGILTLGTNALTTQGVSYPFLNAIQQGIVIPTSSTSAAETLAVASNGANISMTSSSAPLSGVNVYEGLLSGTTTYYVLLSRLGLSATSPIIVYNTSGSYDFNAITVPGTGAASNAITFGTISASNTIEIGGSTNAFYTGTNYSSSISNTLLSTAEGSLGNASGILYAVSGGAPNANLTLNSGVSLVTSTGTTYTLDGSITTTGSQTYNGPVSLTGTPTLTSSGGNGITFDNTINGAQGLTIGNSSGTITFAAAVGGGTALSSLTIGTGDATTLSGNVTTSGAQNYNSAVTLGASDTLTSSNGGITFGSTLDGTSAGSQSLTIANGSGAISFGTIGGSTSLASLTIGTSDATTLNNNVTTSGAQTYNSAVTLGGNVSDSATSGSNGNITFNSTVDGAHALSITSGNTGGESLVFNGAIGSNTPLSSLSITLGSYYTGINGGVVETSGAQTYNGTLAIGANTTFTSTGSGGISIGYETFGAFAISIANNSGTTTLGNIGNGEQDPTTLTVGTGDPTTIVSNIQTSSTEIYNSAITLTGSPTLQANNNITFGSTINGAQALNISSGSGTITFSEAVGGTTPLTSLTVGTGDSTVLNASVTTSGAQTYNSAITLGGNDTLTSSNGGITFGSTLDGTSAGSQSLTIANGSGAISFGTVGGSTSLSGLTIGTGDTTTLNGNVTTAGPQAYNSAVILGSDDTLTTSNTFSSITFGSTVDGTSAGSQSLSIANNSGAISFGTVGGGTSLSSLNIGVNDATTLNGNVTTSDAQVYLSAVTLGANATLTSSNGYGISFYSTINGTSAGAQSLTIANGSGDLTIFNDVGNSTALSSLTIGTGHTTSLYGNVTTTGAQTYNSAVILGTSDTLTSSGGGITFGSTLDGTSAGSQSLSIANGSGAISFGTVGGGTSLSSLTIGTSDATTLNGSVTTSGAQTYNSAVTLGGNDTLTSSNGGITFASTVDDASAGSQSLTISNGSGAISFGDAIGFGNALASLNIGSSDATTLNSSVTTTGAQTYNSAVTLGGSNIVLTSNNGGITFTSSIDGTTAGSQSLTITNVSGTTTFGTIGGSTSLANLIIGVDDPITLNGNVTTTGEQDYNNNAIILGTNITLTSSNGGITFASTIDGTSAGSQSLTIANGSGAVSFGTIGGGTSLSSLTIGTNDATTLNGNVTTSGAQTYNSAVTLGGNDTLTSSNGGITFNSTLDGSSAASLSIANGSGAISFGTVGGSNAFSSLTVGTGDATTLNANVTTTGAQTYNSAVTLDANNITLTSNNGGITFASTIDGTTAGSQALTITNGSGATTFGTIGGSTSLASLTIGVNDPITLNGNVTTTGEQDYNNNAIILGANVTLASSSSGDILFASTIDGTSAGSQSLTIANGSGIVTFGTIGGSTSLSSLTIGTGDTTTLNGNVTTSGAQTYNSAVTLGASDTLTSSTGAGITFGSTIRGLSAGSESLTISNSSGAISFGDTIGSAASLSSLFIGSADPTTLNGSVTTSGDQTYTSGVVLGGNDTFTSSNSEILFGASLGGTTAGSQSLSIANGSGSIYFGSDIGGGGTSLSSISIGTGDATTLSGNVTTTGAQNYNSAVTLAGNPTLTSSNSGITFASTINATSSGAQGLTIANGSGAVSFGGAIGGATSLFGLTIGTGDAATFDGNVTTTGNQSYNSAITLGASSVSFNVTGNNNSIAINDGITSSAGDSLTLLGNSGHTNSFTLIGPFTLANITVTGGSSGSSTLEVGNANQTWNITGANAGNLSGISGSTISGNFSFSNIANINGGTGNNTFNLTTNSSSLSGTITGGSGSNSLNYSYTTPVSINVNNSSATGIDGGASSGFSGITTFSGGTGSNTFTDTTGSNTWDITSNNGGTVGSYTFSNFGSLAGGSGDSFVLSAGKTLSGTISATAGTLNESAYTTATNVNLTNSSATGIDSGAASGFSGITTFVGSSTASNTLTDTAGSNTWNITANNGGSVAGNSFSNFGTLTGGNGDTFTLSAGKTLSGTISATAGTLNESAYTTATNVNLTNSSATGIDGGAASGFSGITTFVGSSTASNTLTDTAGSNTWSITANNGGSVAGNSFSNFGTLTGGSGDTFTLSAGKTLSGTISATAGTLNESAYTTATNVNLTNSSATGIDGGAASGFSGITSFIGSSTASNTLTDTAGSNTWSITANNGGSVAGNSFSNFGTLTGGSGDTFTLSAGKTLSGTISATAGTLNEAAYTTATNVNLTNSSATGIDGGAASGFSGITTFVGSSTASNTLTDTAGSNTWSITANNGGSVAGNNFSNFGSLVGGNGDIFSLSNGITLSGSITGGSTSGSTLDLSNYATATNFTLSSSSSSGFSGTVTPVAGGFSNIVQINGSSTANNTLTGENTTNTWTISGSNNGSLSDSNATLSWNNFGNLTSGTGNNTFNFGSNSISGNLSLNATTGNTDTLNGAVSAASITSASGGTTDIDAASVTTSGAQTYNSAVTLSSDSLLSSSGSAGISFNSTLDGAEALTIANNSGTVTFGGLVGNGTALTSLTIGSGDATNVNTSLMQTSGAQNYNSDITLGTSSSFNGGQLSLGNIDGASASENLTINTSSTNSDVSGVVGSNVGNLTVNSASGYTGTLTLSSANTYTGSTTIDAGTLLIGVSNAVPTSSTLTIASGATFGFNGFDVTLSGLTGSGNLAIQNATLTIDNTATDDIYSGILSGNGNFVLDGNAGTTLTFDTASTYTGTTTINGGTLQAGIANAFADSSGITVASGATFDLNNYNNTIASLAGAGNVSLGSATLTTGSSNASTTFSGSITGTGGLTQAGTGTLTLSGNNSYQGGTNINAGIIVASNSNALGAAMSNVTVAPGAELEINNVAINNPVTLNGGTLMGVGTASLAGNLTLASANTFATSNSTDSFTLNGSIDGASDLTLSGPGSITIAGIVGGNTPLSSLTSNAGTTTISNNITTTGSQTYNNAVVVGANSTLSVNNGNMTFSGSIIGNGNNLTLSSANNANVLSILNSNSQTWNISSANSGSINGVVGSGNLGFNGFGNVIGGSGSNSFVFSNGASLSGTLNGGTNPANNTVNFSAYSSPVYVNMASQYAASVQNSASQSIANFSNIGNISDPTGSTLQTPSNTVNVVHITGVGTGYVNDPLNFSGISNIVGSSNTSVVFDTNVQLNTNSSTVTATIGSTTITFTGISSFSGDISIPILQTGALYSALVQTDPSNINILTPSDTFDSQPQSISTSSSSSSNSDSSSGSNSTSTSSTSNSNQPTSPVVTVNQNLNQTTQSQQQADLQHQQNQSFSGGCSIK